jgi:hypothetical protein
VLRSCFFREQKKIGSKKRKGGRKGKEGGKKGQAKGGERGGGGGGKKGQAAGFSTLALGTLALSALAAILGSSGHEERKCKKESKLHSSVCEGLGFASCDRALPSKNASWIWHPNSDRIQSERDC